MRKAVEPRSLLRVGRGDHAHRPRVAAPAVVAWGPAWLCLMRHKTVAKASRLDAHQVLGAGMVGVLGKTPPNRFQRLTTRAAPQGLCLASWAAFSVPRSPQRWVQPGGPVTHFPRPRGLSGRYLPLFSGKASFVLLLASLHNPSPFFALQTQVQRCFRGTAVIRVELAQAGTSRVVWLYRRLAYSLCPLGSPTAPDTRESPHLHAQVVGLQLAGEQGCWMGTRKRGRVVWIAHPDGHHPEPSR